MGGRADLRVAGPVAAVQQRLREVASETAEAMI